MLRCVHVCDSLLTIFAKVLISANTQSGQSRSPQKRNRYENTILKDIVYSAFTEVMSR